MSAAPDPAASAAPPAAHTSPARARALAGPSGTGRPRTGISTTTSTASGVCSTEHDTTVAWCEPAIPRALPQPPSASSNIRSAAARAARSAADSARCRVTTTDPTASTPANTTHPSMARAASQTVAEPASGTRPPPPRPRPVQRLPAARGLDARCSPLPKRPLVTTAMTTHPLRRP